MNKRLWILPVAILILLFLIQVGAWWWMIDEVNRLPQGPMRSIEMVLLRGQLAQLSTYLWPTVFLADIIVLIVIRKKIHDRRPVIVFSILMVVTFILLPGIFLIFRDYNNRQWNFLSIHKIILWFTMVVTHLFLILSILNTFKKREAVHETPGLLDEFVN